MYLPCNHRNHDQPRLPVRRNLVFHMLYATMLLSQSLDGNNNFQSSTWKHPNKNIAVNAMPITSEGECREFVTSIQVNKELRQMRGTACKINNEWQLKEIY